MLIRDFEKLILLGLLWAGSDIFANEISDEFIKTGKKQLIEANYSDAIESFKRAKKEIEAYYQPLPVSWTDDSDDERKIEKYNREMGNADDLIRTALEFIDLKKRIQGIKPEAKPIKVLEMEVSVTREITPLKTSEISENIQKAINDEYSVESLSKARKVFKNTKNINAAELIGIKVENEKGESGIRLYVFVSPEFSEKEIENYEKYAKNNLKPDRLAGSNNGIKIKDNLIARLKKYFGYNENELWIYRSKVGNKDIIGRTFEEAEPFEGKYAFVKQNGLWGMINRDMEFVIEPKYFSKKDIVKISKKTSETYENQNQLEEIKLFLLENPKQNIPQLRDLALEKEYEPSFSLYGIYLAEQKNPEATIWLQKAAQNDDPIALNKIGELYEEGLFFQKNQKEARRFYLKAADMGFVPALANIIKCYYKGIGGEKNNLMALKYVIKAEDYNAFLNPFNSSEDLAWIQNGASQNIPECIYILAQKYEVGSFNENGNGYRIEPDLKKAIELYQLAAQKGLQIASKKYAELKLRQL